MENSKTYLAVPPGETLKELIEDRGMTQKELADRLDVSPKHVSELINGKVGLTEKIALKLE
ncbi:helix-turn-helix transcriptional regulator, partial [Ileibacterium valens]